MQEALRIQSFFTALPLAFGLLHLFLFAALPRLRSNLYYSLFLVFIAATIFLDFQEQIVGWTAGGMALLRPHRACLALSFVFALRFFYEVFLTRAPSQFRYLAAGTLVTGMLAAARPVDWFWPLQFFLIAGILEVCRAMVVALRRRQEDARLLAGGFLTFAAFATYDVVLDFGLIDPVRSVTNAYQFGLVGLFVATSAFLARGIARTNRQLVEEERMGQELEVERRLLEAEVERATAELEDARALQLSMLPSVLPNQSGIEIAVHMSTATEVGGDYYDVRKGIDGTLTLALGDATGHGLRAGIMVAVAKSLFQGLRDDEELTAFFDRCTRVLKPMRLGNLFMALTIVRLRDDVLTVAAAGMPPLLVYRAKTGEVERVTLKGMPLGAFFDFPYRQVRLSFHAGDAVLLMTDGLEELFNAEREMLGMNRVETAFREVTSHAPEEIITHLRAVGEAWRAESPQEDDLTLLVLKARARS